MSRGPTRRSHDRGRSRGNRAATVRRALRLALSGRDPDSSPPEGMLLLRNIEVEDATMVAAASSEVVAHPSEHHPWELEGDVARWIDGQGRTELNGLVMFCWLSLPLDRWLDSSFGLGGGLS